MIIYIMHYKKNINDNIYNALQKNINLPNLF
jgi:hypothetical protein